MEFEKTIKRQAVVVIHGIGEQRPMETLRGFVSGVKQKLEELDEAEKKSTVRSKPDSIGDIYETVRLSMDSTAKRPITDFYEFYWAHNMRNTKISQMSTWFKRLVFAKRSKVPPALKSLYDTVWVLLIAAPVIAYFVSSYFSSKPLNQFLAPFITATVFPFIMSFLATTFKSVFLNYAGDAARYFTPEPDNIGERSHIRQQGIQFLQKLHTISNNEKVDRIILVGHSLGTVVAYDLLRLLWTEYNRQYDELPEVNQEYLEQINKYANGSEVLDQNSLDKFRDLQYKVWKEQRQVGNKWLISDFVTLGAAINAIDYFMVTDEKVDNLIQQRELPICPPTKDEKDNNIYYNSYPAYTLADGQKRTVKLLNHAGLFAACRWTNIYYSCDFVGGPMTRIFGKGIKDICIQRKSLWILPGGHTKYWDKSDSQNALTLIVNAMQLNSKVIPQ